MDTWTWLVVSDAGLLVRIAAGVAILVALAWWDWRRKGAEARRWREYTFLLAVALGAVVFAAALDQVSVTLSWEYFYFGKELHEVLGAQCPPEQASLRVQASLIGLKAGLAPGLLIGVALLIANNPRKGRPALPMWRLVRAVAWPLALATLCIAAVSAAGYAGWLTWMSQDFREIVTEDVMRPMWFMAAWGAHLGAYVGGALGAIIAVARVLRARRAAVASHVSHQGE